MTDIVLTIDDRRYRVVSDRGTDISLPLDFHGDQPAHFGAPPATAAPLHVGEFIGDTSQGGSCNCETLTLVPHCNGTHTESVGHLATPLLSVSQLAVEALIPTLLVSVEDEPAGDCGETADPRPRPGDTMITAAALSAAVQRSGHRPQSGLVIRTLPNDPGKRARNYAVGAPPPYLSSQAAELLVAWQVRHLLVDLPSIDRTHDEGRLSGHRRFWGLAQGDSLAGQATRPEATITEMVFAPNRLADGLYAMSLQIAPFVTDAAPSRPLLFPLEPA